ncbi:nucleotide pyrophosphohydrolase [Gemelliphila palaticanis]|uniref:Nucleotide pyrophosphohydrolase n=1 Tax=Gemelliphila palaticanis TaxID=81950 RepID=A0ABX2T1U1_9BACL|nr:nucleotide pyrophosphohydrolase [Gemella palaticanis]MBF0715494.1 nucleotide pyrophosphohydrolase [Gemella palaticanis]NYS47424.1 nucleotide pyrophosphohydrolase [Gemella palaticanis]
MQELKETIESFRRARNWHYENPGMLSKSIIIEAAELLEHFQWGDDNSFNKEEVEKEIADVLIYTLSLCYHLNLDPKEIIESKLKEVAIKYPIKDKEYKHE